MLMLGRKVGDDIVLSWAGQEVVVRVEAINGSKVRLGIMADRAVKILRGELLSSEDRAAISKAMKE